MPSWLKQTLIVLVVVLAAIQFVRPAQINPGTDPNRTIHAQLALDPVASAAITRSCGDCHSNQTAWRWYSRVAPVSWLVANDVYEGRQAVNYSDWAAYPPDQQRKLLAKTCEEVSEGEMPPIEYVILHPSARLSKEDVSAICVLAPREAPVVN